MPDEDRKLKTRAPHDVTVLLERWREGSAGAADELMARVHGELRKLAASYLRRERGGHTLDPTAVVHEAYLRLVPQRSVRWENRAHFFGIAAQMMRRVLVDHARKRAAAKRDGVAAAPVTVSGVPDPAPRGTNVDVIAVNEALTALAKIDPRQARIVEMRYFAGLTVEEVAEALHISPATVKREWSLAKMWLKRRLQSR